MGSVHGISEESISRTSAAPGIKRSHYGAAVSRGADKWLVLVLVSKESGYSLVISPSAWSWANLTSLGLDFHICKIRDLYPLSFQNENVKVLRWDYIFPKSKLRINSSTFAINSPVSNNRCCDRKVRLLTLGKCRLNWHCYVPENWVLSRSLTDGYCLASSTGLSDTGRGCRPITDD